MTPTMSRMSCRYSRFLSVYSDWKKISDEGIKSIPILICICGPESEKILDDNRSDH
jgi:hypothetical protein